MKAELKVLYKKDKSLALQVAKVLGYRIILNTSKLGLDEISNYLSKIVFVQINEYANTHGYRFNSSAGEFEKYLNKFLVSKLK